jgi:hypothetical protein
VLSVKCGVVQLDIGAFRERTLLMTCDNFREEIILFLTVKYDFF